MSTGLQKDRKTCQQKDWLQKDRKTCQQKDWLTERFADRQTDRQTDRKTERLLAGQLKSLLLFSRGAILFLKYTYMHAWQMHLVVSEFSSFQVPSACLTFRHFFDSIIIISSSSTLSCEFTDHRAGSVLKISANSKSPPPAFIALFAGNQLHVWFKYSGSRV